MRALLQRVARAPGGRRGKWLVLAVWLILAVALGPLAGKLGDVEESGPNAFLPRGAESARVNTELEEFRTDTVMPAVVVYTGDGAKAQSKATADRAAFTRYVPAGQEVSQPIPSEDGKALMTIVPLDIEDELTDKVDELRDVAGANAPPGVDVEVGGPAGSLTDSVAVFDGLDTTLLLATGVVVAILLLLTYRSPVLWLLPLISVGFAAVLTQATTYLLAKHAGLPVDPQSAGVLMVLVFGVGTDYALLLIARYREELHRHEDRHEAMRIALHRSGPAILASAATIAVGLSCLAFADINSSRSLGLVGAVGVVCGFLAMVTVLPALLVVVGRWVFWPFVPHDGTPARKPRTIWSRVGATVARRPRWSWLMSVAVTGVLALSAVGINMGLTQAEMFQDKPESVVAQERISAHYPSGAADPADIITPADRTVVVRAAASAVDGVARVEDDTDRTPNGELTALTVVLEDAPDSQAAKDTIDDLREAVHPMDALVGGTTAETLDTQRAADRDLTTVVPIVLLVVLAVLILLLRALVAPFLLLATVVLSYFAALGASNLIFEHVLDFAGVDWSIPLMGFVFLVALGIDYNIFLMHRVREETGRLGHERGVLEGLTSTGGVITSAGIVLAATFAIFAGLPLVTMAQMGVLVGIGVLLDTFLVRTVLVPALALDLGRWFWWPGSLFRVLPRTARDTPGSTAATTPDRAHEVA
ncbi:MMPL family transporter [Streptomyces chromofuscus]|uniref:MMPL family transporter n=1 Tax=Streptomyces chromofuscus TaxID=42881 RepID=A0A7M2T110_STRCW|nr:MMPL family transporter [Streptomyces chromofuscus]QOV42024.1 MMPL family transporter [Streptomyces chromofuscus]GGS86252.1 putative membrane protein ActII-3 [Streptomyces chromofuscus]